MLKPPGGGSSDIFGTTEAAGSNSNGGNKKQFSSQFSLGNDEDVATAEPQRKSSVDSIDGASTTSSQTSTTNGSPNTSEPNTPRSGTPLLTNHHFLFILFFFFSLAFVFTLIRYPYVVSVTNNKKI